MPYVLRGVTPVMTSQEKEFYLPPVVTACNEVTIRVNDAFVSWPPRSTATDHCHILAA